MLTNSLYRTNIGRKVLRILLRRFGNKKMRGSSKPQFPYPNLDNISFLILYGQFFYCIDDNGKSAGRLDSFIDAYLLPRNDDNFALASDHLIVNWRKVTKIDYLNEVIFIKNTPVWFNYLSNELLKKLLENRHPHELKKRSGKQYPVFIDTIWKGRIYVMESLRKYAELLVRAGGNVQEGQAVVINSPVEHVEFARLVQEYAYDAGAKEVIINFRDEVSLRTKYLRAHDSIFDEYPDWMVERFNHWDKNEVVYLHIISPDPDLMKGVDSDRLKRSDLISSQKAKNHDERMMSYANRWSVVSLPSPKWAAKVFPHFGEDEGMKALLSTIMKCSRADGDNPIGDWIAHRKSFEKRLDYLNNKQYASLRLTNSLGTNLTVGLPKNHIWKGGGNVCQNGLPFFPNIPTEEIFTAPDKHCVTGVVVASMPLNHHGSLIEGIRMEFIDGRVSEYSAETNQEILENIIEMDEGSHFLGEIALVSHDSPISQLGLLFYNTLFDENASSHLALGKAYPDCVQDGSKMSAQELEEAGINNSLTHVDIMFGTSDMKVTATEADGTETAIMESGVFAFSN